MIVLASSAALASTLRPVLPQDGVVEPERLLKELYQRVQGGEDSWPDEEAQSRVKNSLIMIGEANAEDRLLVIRAIDKMVGDTQFEFDMHLHHFAADVLEKLKAIDVLIKHMNYSDILATWSSYSTPYIKALVEIGEPSIPQLEEALANGSYFTRCRAAKALGNIGTTKAEEALEKARATEKDTNVLSLINEYIRVLSEPPPPGKITRRRN
jgi:hypothetical protein